MRNYANEWRVRYRREGDRWDKFRTFQLRANAERYMTKLTSGDEALLGLAPIVVVELQTRPTGDWRVTR